ncbi:MAG: Ig-like domain-containing protein, partial [Terriglobia bacterium]
QLRDSQKEDFRKNKIPLSATDGIVKWVRLDNVPVIGQFIGLNRAQKSIEDASHKRNMGGSASPTAPNFLITPEIYGDCPCPPDYNEMFVYRPICWTMLPGDTCAWTSNGEWVDCEGGDYYFDVTFDSIWSSTNTSVATVDYTALVTAVLPGSSTINAHYADFFYFSGPRCATRLDDYSGGDSVRVNAPQISDIDPPIAMIGSNGVQITIHGAGFSSPTINPLTGVTSTVQGWTPSTIVASLNVSLSATIGQNNLSVRVGGQNSNSLSFTIDGPDHMVVQADWKTFCSNCSTTIERNVTYQIVNFSGTAVGVIPIGEIVTSTGWSCTQKRPGINTTPCPTGSTDSNGMFTDSWSLNSDIYTPIGCGEYSSTDVWKWCAPSPPRPVGTLNGVVHTNTIKINGVTTPPDSMPYGTVIRP